MARSPRNVEVVEGMVAPGMIVSLEMLARRPRWEGVLRRVWKALWSSSEAGVGVS